jgi:hypothetical protein
LLTLRPWEASSVGPSLSTAPGLGIGLGDAVELATPGRVAVAGGHPAGAPQPSIATAAPTAGPEGESRQVRVLAVAPARAVTGSSADAPPVRPVKPPPLSPQPQPAPVPPPAPTPAPTPVATPTAPPAPVAPPPARVVADSGVPGPVGAGTGGEPTGPVLVSEGEEYALSFSFYVEEGVAYEQPGVENSILRFADEPGGPLGFGLQLWDDGSGDARGLWSSGEASDGERFLAPVTEGEWHEASLYFRASSVDDGFYLFALDGQLIDARLGVSLIEAGASSTQIELGLWREGGVVAGEPEVLIQGPELEALESALP